MWPFLVTRVPLPLQELLWKIKRYQRSPRRRIRLQTMRQGSATKDRSVSTTVCANGSTLMFRASRSQIGDHLPSNRRQSRFLSRAPTMIRLCCCYSRRRSPTQSTLNSRGSKMMPQVLRLLNLCQPKPGLLNLRQPKPGLLWSTQGRR